MSATTEHNENDEGRATRERPSAIPADATPIERAAIKRLRSAGWWEGDENALRVVREFAAQIRNETKA